MKYFLTIIALFCGATLPAQVIDLDDNTTRAVVIGISDYQDDAIPDLRFADKDAEAFAQWLRSPAGGALSNDQIVLLTNAKATLGQFSAALDWLIEQCKEGDQAIIYFSGHGDVETKTIMNLGFLLTFNTPPTNYIAGAFPIFYLQSVVATLSQKGVRVVVITDACRAGKLAGNEFGGTQATALNLSKQFANEVKIMSCQPDEFSLEGEQWGGGRGAFSWHLVEGLTGMADKNADGKVQLLEIENYLEEILPKETAPQSQIPMTVGNKSSMVALVDAASLAQLKERKSAEQLALGKIETKGLEQNVLEKVDTSVQEFYAAFLAAVERGDLLEPAGKSANDYYERLILEESLEPLHGFMKRNLAAALHDEAQVAINLYLSTDTAEIHKRWNLDTSYFQLPQYLSRAAELLGENHYMYRNLRGKQYYFQGLLIRLKRFIITGNSFHRSALSDSLTAEAMKLQEQALEYEQRAAFIYHELGLLNSILGRLDAALENHQKSVEISPNWGGTLINLGYLFESFKRYEEAADAYKKAMQLAPDFDHSYAAFVRLELYELGSYEEAVLWFEKMLNTDSTNYYALLCLAECFVVMKKYNEANLVIKRIPSVKSNWREFANNAGIAFDAKKYEAAHFWLKKTYELDSSDLYVLKDLSRLYGYLTEMEKQEKLRIKIVSIDNSAQNQLMLGIILLYNKKPIEALPIFDSLVDSSKMELQGWNLAYLGLANIELGNTEKGLAAFEKALKMEPDYPAPFMLIGEGYLKMKRYEEASDFLKQAFQTIRNLHEKWEYTDPYLYFYDLVWTCAYEGETALALQWLETILKEGYDDYERLQLDRVLAEVRKTQQFKDLMKKYFPDQVKD